MTSFPCERRFTKRGRVHHRISMRSLLQMVTKETCMAITWATLD
jgi:hypothetical protein